MSDSVNLFFATDLSIEDATKSSDKRFLNILGAGSLLISLIQGDMGIDFT